MRLTDLLALSHVPRWSTVRHHRFQSVAEHSYRVIAIYMELCNRCNVLYTVAGFYWAMCHDATEAWTGDIPGNFKKRLLRTSTDFSEIEHGALDWNPMPVVGALSAQDTLMISLADKIEAYTFIQAQGQGAHAERVKQRMWATLIDSVSGGVYERAVRDICRDITTEVERD